MAWLFSKHVDATALLKQADEALQHFVKQKDIIEKEKESQLRRQVEIWSVSTAQSSQGLDDEYRRSAGAVTYSVKKLLCLDEHIKKLRLAIFHAKQDGKVEDLEKALTVVDPCQDVTPEIPQLQFKPSSPES